MENAAYLQDFVLSDVMRMQTAGRKLTIDRDHMVPVFPDIKLKLLPP